MNRENLLKLAQGLEGPLRAEFRMWRFSSVYDPPPDSCGTCGCAVGHATYLVTPRLKGEDWQDYAQRMSGLECESSEAEWCFGGDWDEVDNTPQGAAKRIRWLLEHGLPDDWYEQAIGDAPLCYATTPQACEGEG